MKWLLITGTVLAGLSLPYLLGTITPTQYQASCTTNVDCSPEKVWATITDISAQCLWRRPMQVEVVRCDQNEESMKARMQTPFGSSTIEFGEMTQATRLVIREKSTDLELERTWTFELTANAKGCKLRILEAGEISSPVNRFFAAWVFGYHGSMSIYLTELGKQLGVKPAKIERS